MQNFKQTTLDLNGPVISFTQNPENISVVTGLAVTFVGIVTATFPTQTPANPASNTGSISYQWYESGVGALSNTTTITGTATTSLTLNPVTSPTDNKRQFYLTADYIPSAYGTSPITAGTGRSTGNAINEPISSTTATLTVIPSLSIISQPVAVTDASSETLSIFNITALVSDGSLIGLLTYQWRLNGSNLGNDGDTIGSNNSTLQIRRTAGTYTIDCIVSHPNTIPLTITSSSVNYTTEDPRALLVVEHIDISNQSIPTLIKSEQFNLKTQTVNLTALPGDLNFTQGSLNIERGFVPPGIFYSIYSPEKDITVRIEIAGASAKDYRGRQAGQGGYGVFKITLKKNVEYTFKLGSFDGSFGPTGGAVLPQDYSLSGIVEGSIGGGGAFFYKGTRLILVAGGGGGAGSEAAGGDGSGPGSNRAENGSGRSGGKGGDGGPSNSPSEIANSPYTITTGSAANRAAECLPGTPNFTNAGIDACSDYGLSRFKGNTDNLPEAVGSAVITRGFKTGIGGRTNGGKPPSKGGGSGGGGAKGGNASSGNKCGGGGGSGYYNGGELTLLKSLNGVNIGHAYATIKLFSATDPLPNPVIPPPPNFVSVDWNNLAAPGYKIGTLTDRNQGCAYKTNNIWNIGTSCEGPDYGYIQINRSGPRNNSSWSTSDNFDVTDRSGDRGFPYWSPDNRGNGTDSIASVSYLEWGFALPEFGPVSRNNDSQKSRNYDNLERISDRGGLTPTFLRGAKQDEINGQGDCGDIAGSLNDEAGRILYTCDERVVWGRGFEVGILLEIEVDLDRGVLLPDGTLAANQARYQYITRRYTSIFDSWDSRKTIGMSERFVIPDYYLGCYRTPRLSFIRIEYIDDLTLKNAYPNEISRYRNVGGLLFDMIPNWKFPNSDDRNRRSRESNRVEFGRAVRR